MERKNTNGFSKNTIEVIGGHGNKKAARQRWLILAKALKSPSGSQPSSPTDEYSVRRISSFMLLTRQQIEKPILAESTLTLINNVNKRSWFKYSMFVNDREFSVNIGHRNRTISAEDLMGFNNTGNICIWPSEETMAYYLMSNLNIFTDKKILELGGGMSCLAGFFAAKYSRANFVKCTDGNKNSVENVQISQVANKFSCEVSCEVLKWESFDVSLKFDVILCADCLFFDDARQHLVNAIFEHLNDDGLAIVMAPKRGRTLDFFVFECEKMGFTVNVVFNYNEPVWNRHLQLLENADYDDNIHYPVLIKLTKTSGLSLEN